MGFVKTREEIERIRHAVTAVEFNGGRYLGVDFESDPAFIRSVLPPGLEPRGNNVMSAMVCQFEGGSCGSFKGGAVYIAARHKDIVGQYTLLMYMDSDNAMTFGRDLFGEPKKIAAVNFGVEETRAWGAVERGGVRLIEIHAELDRQGSLEGTTGIDFNYKASLAPNGEGLAADAILTVTTLHLQPTVHRTGTASLKLDGTVHDPLHEVPVGKILSARLIASDFHAESYAATTIPADIFLPYAYGRYPDWGVFLGEWKAKTSAHATEAALEAAATAVKARA
jgi:acetoacetate decarboxylase